MTLVNIEGRYGSGKTLIATALAIDAGKPIYSNYKINSPLYTPVTPELLFEIDTGTIVLDEVYTWLESRTSGKPTSIYLSHILNQSRKRDMDFLITDQLLKTVDVRFRDSRDYDIRCKAIPNYKNPIGFRYTIIDLIERSFVRLFLSVETAKTKGYFDTYDTLEIVTSIDDEMMVKVSSSKKGIVRQVEDITDDMLNEGFSKITQSVVRGYVIRNDYPKSYVQMIWDTLKMREALADSD